MPGPDSRSNTSYRMVDSPEGGPYAAEDLVHAPLLRNNPNDIATQVNNATWQDEGLLSPSIDGPKHLQQQEKVCTLVTFIFTELKQQGHFRELQGAESVIEKAQSKRVMFDLHRISDIGLWYDLVTLGTIPKYRTDWGVVNYKRNQMLNMLRQLQKDPAVAAKPQLLTLIKYCQAALHHSLFMPSNGGVSIRSCLSYIQGIVTGPRAFMFKWQHPKLRMVFIAMLVIGFILMITGLFVSSAHGFGYDMLQIGGCLFLGGLALMIVSRIRVTLYREKQVELLVRYLAQDYQHHEGQQPNIENALKTIAIRAGRLLRLPAETYSQPPPPAYEEIHRESPPPAYA